jgi:hypothetical protein
MKENALLLRQALKALNMTSAALAQELTRMRDDGRETGQATISRWLTGASPVEPAVLCWLRELLRGRVREHGRNPLFWGTRESLRIGVGNFKGGVGVSTIAAALAIIARRELRQPTRHMRIKPANDEFGLVLQSAGVESRSIDVAGLWVAQPELKDIVIVDIPRDVPDNFFAAVQSGAIQFDLFVVPADFGSGADIGGTRKFLERLPTNANLALLHYPLHEVNLQFVEIARDRGFDVFTKQFVPFAFPRSLDADFFPSGLTQEWRNEDQCLLKNC